MVTVVVGVDYSPPSKKALDAAVELAKSLKASLVLVYAATPLPPGTRTGHLDALSQVNAEIDADELHRLATTWAKAASKHVPLDVVSRPGRPDEVLLDEAKSRKAAYVVVGSHGRTGLKRVVLGSVAQAVVRDSKIPVLVVP